MVHPRGEGVDNDDNDDDKVQFTLSKSRQKNKADLGSDKP